MCNTPASDSRDGRQTLSYRKTESGGRTYTKIKELDTAGRTDEIARMHGGANISEVTRKSALEQIQGANKFKENIDG